MGAVGSIVVLKVPLGERYEEMYGADQTWSAKSQRRAVSCLRV